MKDSSISLPSGPVGGLELEPRMVLILEGDFLMGSEQGGENERPVHPVWLDAFEIAVTTVTNREYLCFIGETGRRPPPYISDPVFSHPEQPVVAVSWYDALAYCEELSRKTAKNYRLPSESQWEKAARGGMEGKLYPWGDEFPSGTRHYERGWKTDRPDPVGQHEPNGFGLYNMADNVHEWCLDYYDSEYYSCSPARNPQGPSQGTRRSSRGGSWRHQIKITRCAARSSIPPDHCYADYGFRVATSTATD